MLKIIGIFFLGIMLSGIFMEVPQRMVMQSFIYMLMIKNDINIGISVPITALIWCASICIQCMIFKLSAMKSEKDDLRKSKV